MRARADLFLLSLKEDSKRSWSRSSRVSVKSLSYPCEHPYSVPQLGGAWRGAATSPRRLRRAALTCVRPRRRPRGKSRAPGRPEPGEAEGKVPRPVLPPASATKGERGAGACRARDVTSLPVPVLVPAAGTDLCSRTLCTESRSSRFLVTGRGMLYRPAPNIAAARGPFIAAARPAAPGTAAGRGQVGAPPPAPAALPAPARSARRRRAAGSPRKRGPGARPGGGGWRPPVARPGAPTCRPGTAALTAGGAPHATPSGSSARELPRGGPGACFLPRWQKTAFPHSCSSWFK